MNGIIMTADSVCGILDGRKTKTRRVVNPQPTEGANGYWYSIRKGHHYTVRAPYYEKQQDGTCMYPWGPGQLITRCAPYKPGEILYVKEAWRLTDYQYIDGVWSASAQYKADMTIGPRLFWPDGSENGYDRTGWRSPMFMPRAAARIFLRVTDAKVERVQEITEEDAIAEGANWLNGRNVGFEEKLSRSAIDRYREMWDSINAKRDGGIYAWERDPWIWAYTFERISKEEAERS